MAFNGLPATRFTVLSKTRLQAYVPTGATTGTIAVTTSAGTGTSTTNFTVTPWITSFTPARGRAGTLVTITGGNFTGATSVTFRGRSATFTVNSSTRITATVPTRARTGRIAVRTPAGTGTSSTRFIVGGFMPHQPAGLGNAQGRPGAQTGTTLADDGPGQQEPVALTSARSTSTLGSSAAVVDLASETGALTEPTSATSTATHGPQVMAQMASLGLGLSGPADGTAIRFSLTGSGLMLLKGLASGPDTFSDEGSGDARGMHLSLKPSPLANGRQPLVSTTAWRYSFYTPEMNLLSETELRTTPGTPQVLYEYIWFNGHPVAQVDAGIVTHWTFTDHLGTPIIQTTSAGNVYWQAESEPFGKVFALRTADQHQPLRLPGQEAEQLNLGPNGVTERSYNIFRWYRNGWGRYTQGDPLANPFALRQGSYSYVAGNPLGLVDPLGLSPCGPCCQTDGQRQEDKRRIMTAINIALYSYNATHFYVPQTQCETYSAIVSGAIGKAKPKCFDWNDVFSQEKSWLGIFSQYYNEPAHTATVLRPCNASGWPDGTILDAWPEGLLKEFSWDQWKPKLGGGRYSPIVYDPMGGGRGTCPFKP